MSEKRKTIRFRDNPDEMAVYNAIKDFSAYGFRSGSHMIIEAVRRLMEEKDQKEYSPERMAELIAEHLSRMLPDSLPAKTCQAEQSASDAAFDAALSFLENL